MTKDKLYEGGNSLAVDRNKTEKWDRENFVVKAHAQKIDMSKIQKSTLKKEFIKTFKKLNDLVKQETGKPIWDDFNVVESGIAFNGSSTWMFNDEISDAEFKKYKPTVGDIDITVPKDRMIDLFNVLLKYEDTKIGNIEYIGNNRKSASEKQQINAVFRYTVPNSDYVAYPQVDFEPSDYENDNPTEWDSFSHSSEWSDIKKGFKGVNHKYALSILARIMSKDFNMLPSVMLDKGADKKIFWECTESVGNTIKKIKSTELPKKTQKGYDENELLKVVKTLNSRVRAIRKKTKGTHVNADHYLAFSVSKGVRVKYKSAVTSDNKPIMIDGKMLLISLDSKNATYEKQLKPIFKLLFNYTPSDSDLKKMRSFVGVIELMQKSKLKDRKKIYDEFLNKLVLEKLWGHPPFYFARAQELERDSKEVDAKIKWSMVNYIMEELHVGKLNEIKAIANSYYASWQGTASDDIKESINFEGKTFRQIFEAIATGNNNAADICSTLIYPDFGKRTIKYDIINKINKINNIKNYESWDPNIQHAFKLNVLSDLGLTKLESLKFLKMSNKDKSAYIELWKSKGIINLNLLRMVVDLPIKQEKDK